MTVKFDIKLHNADPRWTPQRQHDDDAGFDLVARGYQYVHEIKTDRVRERISIKPGQCVLAKTGVFIGLRSGWEAQIRPRSGLALKKSITVANSPGTIDAGYRNEIGVILTNIGLDIVEFSLGDRIAQMVIKEIPFVELTQRAELGDTERGMGGFGSTGE